MTDERPAEPDISGVREALGTGHQHDGECDELVCSSFEVEAAARLCAIEYAESRVRAMTCYRDFCSGLGPNEADGGEDSEYCSKPGYRACPYHAELAALARLKAGETADG